MFKEEPILNSFQNILKLSRYICIFTVLRNKIPTNCQFLVTYDCTCTSLRTSFYTTNKHALYYRLKIKTDETMVLTA